VFALVVFRADDPNKIVAARNGPPVVIGLGKTNTSSPPTCPRHPRAHPRPFFLGDGDLAVLTPNGVASPISTARPVERKAQHVTWDPIMAEKGGFKHFMLKEIYRAAARRPRHHFSAASRRTPAIFLDEMDISPKPNSKLREVKINIACGTSWHAGLAGKFMIENLARIPGRSRLRQRVALSRSHPRPDTTDASVISQSGETADTIAAQREAKPERRKDARHLQRRRLDDHARSRGTVYTHAGPEIGVASTKAFTGQLAALYALRAVSGAGARHHDSRAAKAACRN
jgi:glucosamine--fructose-6-phosphate aminotransferase (isomerizing)